MLLNLEIIQDYLPEIYQTKADRFFRRILYTWLQVTLCLRNLLLLPVPLSLQAPGYLRTGF